MSEKPEKKPRCNPLIGIIIFLVIALITVLSVVIILRLTDKKEAIHLSKPEKLIGKEDLKKITKKPSDKNDKNKKEEVISPGDKELMGKLNKSIKVVCNSPECIHLAHQLHNYRDPSIDPCIDFYKASCGRYTEFSASEGSRMKEKVQIFQRLMGDFLRKKQNSTSKPENTIRKLYRKCESLKDPKKWDSELQKIMVEVLKNVQKIGAWPILDENWDSKKFNLNDYLVNMAKVNMQDFGIFSWEQTKNFLINTPEVDKFLRKEEMEYLTLQILQINNINITNKTENQVSADLEDVFKLLKIFKKLDGSEKGRIPLSLVKKRVPSVDFDRLLKAILGSRTSEFGNLEKRVLSRDLDLFSDKTKNLEILLKTFPPRTIANYLIFTYISSAFKLKPYEIQCEQFVVDTLPQASLLVLVRNYFDRENIKLAAKMVEELKKSFIQIFETSEWLSPKTKKNAIRKLELMTFLAGYPDNGWEEDVERMHQKLTISPKDTFLTTINKIKGFRIENSIDRVLSDSKFDPERPMVIVNAYYHQPLNHLAITVPFLDDPHFDSTFPKYAQLAAVGRVLAHEIGHGFDRKGIYYEGDGNHQKKWGDTEKKEEDVYWNRTDCLVEQYENYDDPDYGKNLDGDMTIGEMIADQLGAQATWLTFKRLNLTEELEIFGFEGQDIEKMFFRIGTLDHCMGSDPTPLNKKLKRKHPTSSFRVNGVFSNMKQFAETFNCKIGTPMNPVKKCEIF